MHLECLTGYSFMNGNIQTDKKYNRYDLYHPLLFLLAAISISHCYDLYYDLYFSNHHPLWHKQKCVAMFNNKFLLRM